MSRKELARKVFRILEEDLIFEEMDRMMIEEELMDLEGGQEMPGTSSIGKKLMVFGGLAGIFMIGQNFVKKEALAGLAVAGAGAYISASYLQQRFALRSFKNAKLLINQMERTRNALRKRNRICFGVLMQVPRHQPIFEKSCRLMVDGIRMIVEQCEILNNDSDTPLLSEFWTTEIQNTIMYYSEDGLTNDSDHEEAFEMLISIFRLHISEYFRLLIERILEEAKYFWDSIRIMRKVENLTKKFAEIEYMTLKVSNRQTRKVEKGDNQKMKNEVDWEGQLIVGLEAILEGIEKKTLNRNQAELAVRKVLTILTPVKIDEQSAMSSIKQPIQSETNEMMIDAEVQRFERFEKTDIDMVFEGKTMSETEKRNELSTTARDVLLDGIDARKHEKSLMGELEMVLEPRRNVMAEREMKALARFRGIDVEELKKEEEEEEEEEHFDGIGMGEEEQLEGYDWRKEAEGTFGLHKTVNDIDFLNALVNRCVDEDVLE